jgi:hypothetical protein
MPSFAFAIVEGLLRGSGSSFRVSLPRPYAFPCPAFPQHHLWVAFRRACTHRGHHHVNLGDRDVCGRRRGGFVGKSRPARGRLANIGLRAYRRDHGFCPFCRYSGRLYPDRRDP